ncbi:MAG: heme-copper oxidase subunit III [Verrucomicrobia bacterium]|nr:MAG: heme-copper oxidase subunit III [Verrucomicrobiota bacterium]
MSHAATGEIDPHLDPTTATGIPNKKLIMWAFLASDCMFFGSLIATHLVYRLNPIPGNANATDTFDIELTSFSTFILLMSSLMMALAVNAIQKGNLKSMRRCLYTTIFFGLIFLGCQVYEFHHFVYEKGLTLGSSVFGSTFFVLTGTHGCHVAGGVLWLLSLTLYSYTGRVGKAEAIDVETAGLYWHFVDIVWIVIFTVVYLIEYVPLH